MSEWSARLREWTTQHETDAIWSDLVVIIYATSSGFDYLEVCLTLAYFNSLEVILIRASIEKYSSVDSLDCPAVPNLGRLLPHAAFEKSHVMFVY